jgi:hypothetical protein
MQSTRKSKLAWLMGIACALFLQGTGWAHHSLIGEFDTTVELEVRGAITKVEWTNPHIWIYLDVTAENGNIEQWECEMGSPNQLFRQGWKKEDLPIGTVIRAQANPPAKVSTSAAPAALRWTTAHPCSAALPTHNAGARR